MGIQEKEIVELFNKMFVVAQNGQCVQPNVNMIGILTAARVLKQEMENCCIEICGAIEQSRPEYELKLTLDQANAIIDMEDIGYGEGLCPDTDETFEAWDEMVELAQIVTGRKSFRKL